MQEIWDAGLIPGSGRSPAVGNCISSFLAWEIPWIEGPGGLTAHGCHKELDMTKDTKYIISAVFSPNPLFGA